MAPAFQVASCKIKCNVCQFILLRHVLICKTNCVSERIVDLEMFGDFKWEHVGKQMVLGNKCNVSFSMHKVLGHTPILARNKFL